MKLKNWLVLVSVLVFMRGSCWAVGANGLSVQVTGVRSLGMANAYVGLADDPGTNYMNPAGLNQLEGWQTTVGLVPVLYNTDYEAPGVNDSLMNQTSVIPDLFLTGHLNDRIAFGFGVTSPFGLGSEW